MRAWPRFFSNPWLVMLVLWLLVAVADIIWLHLDQAPPGWDQGDHLSRALNHWRSLQQPQWGSPDWWQTLWQQAPTQRGPLVYLLTVPLFGLLNPGADQAVLVNLMLTAVMLVSIYLMGRRLFSPLVGLWAAGLSLLSPTLAALRITYLLDFGLAAVFSVALMSLTYWWMAESTRRQWLWMPIWGISLGLTLLTRTSGLLFVIPPLVWAVAVSLWQRRWQQLLQILAGGAIAVLVIWPWFSTNWLTIVSTTFGGAQAGVIYRKSPQVNSLAGWLFYLQVLPEIVSMPVLLASLGTWLAGIGAIALGKKSSVITASLSTESEKFLGATRRGWLWLVAFLIGIYLLGTIGPNKQPRIIIAFFPAMAIVLARGLTLRSTLPWRWLRWGAVALSGLVLLGRMFALPDVDLIQGAKWPPYRGDRWPNHAVIETITRDMPYLQSTLGLAVNTLTINPQNMDFYGALADFQVNGRQLSFSSKTALQDSRYLNWYLTKTGYQGDYGSIEAGQARLREALETSNTLEIFQRWQLPDRSELRLLRRKTPQVRVEPLDQIKTAVEITVVEVAEQLAPGQAFPITYQIEGPWQALQNGLLLLSWQPLETNSDRPTWISDHGIALGQLKAGESKPKSNSGFRVTESLAVLPPASLQQGRYQLQASYLNRNTNESYDLALPPVQVELQAGIAAPAQVPPLDLVTVLRRLAADLPVGAIDPVFSEVGRINQYDATQDYLRQTEQAMTHRLSQSPDQLDWLYSLLLAQILQQKAPEAIATLETITRLNPENPYNWAYLGFVRLYQWQPWRADQALAQAEQLQPDLPNLRLLQAIAAALKLNLPRALKLLELEGAL
ncbi:phospholipid carrier-dependent glycosyltransferase [Sphaerothrix gracilis]|uniref:phospholipid carrier-dependent glycosyltransferase n=1 Tax=Sphaerothrix gracilis TaxID=3151835 RepID=UPI0031FD7532